MKIARFLHAGQVRVGSVVGNQIHIITIDGDDPVLVALRHAALRRDPAEFLTAGSEIVELDDVQLLPPVERVGKFLAVGLNYADHTTESKMHRPDMPIVFTKQTTCISGPHDEIHLPSVSDQVDYEGELAVVIGRRASRVPADRAHEVIGGYLITNDVSVRDWQLATPTMTMGKSFDTHGPIGPWITTADEVADAGSLGIRTWVNAQLRQDGNTRDLLTPIEDIVAYISRACTLEPGDIIATGTPAGVGFAMKPPRFLRDGDTVRIEIEGLGALENTAIDEPDSGAVIDGFPSPEVAEMTEENL